MLDGIAQTHLGERTPSPRLSRHMRTVRAARIVAVLRLRKLMNIREEYQLWVLESTAIDTGEEKWSMRGFYSHEWEISLEAERVARPFKIVRVEIVR